MHSTLEAHDWMLILTGFVVVLIALAGNAIVTAVIGLVFKSIDEKAKKKKAVATPATPVSSIPQHTEDPAIAAVIAASVAVVLGGTPHRIVSVEIPNLDYSRSGRSEHFASKVYVPKRNR